MEDLGGHVKRRAIAGVRWTLALNLVTLPLSFLTNMILGRTSAEALGYYSAVQVFVGAFNVFFVPGGRDVFTRLVPSIPRAERLSFLTSYLLIVIAILAAGALTMVTLGKPVLLWVLGHFGIPGAGWALGLCLASVVFAFTSYFLYSLLEAPRATITLKSIVFLFFLCAVLGWGPLREVLQAGPSAYLWPSAVAIYGSGAVIGVAFVARTREARGRTVWKRALPKEFWQVVLYAHLGTVVAFAYTGLAPSFVLVWLDVESLARLHAALRYGVLVTALPVMASSVIAPGVSKLDASGMRETGLRTTATAVRGALLVIYPACLALIFFAGDAMAVFNPEFREHREILRITALITLAGPLVHLGGGLAIALGAFREYLLASVIVVVAAVALNSLLVPTIGLPGAALAAAGGAFVQQVALAMILKIRLGFRVPGRVIAAWVCGIAASGVTLAFDPGRLASAGLLGIFLAAFAVAGRVTAAELLGWGRRMLGRS